MILAWPSMRVTGSMTRRWLMALPVPELSRGASGTRPLAGQSTERRAWMQVGVRAGSPAGRASTGDDLVQRQHPVEQPRHDAGRVGEPAGGVGQLAGRPAPAPAAPRPAALRRRCTLPVTAQSPKATTSARALPHLPGQLEVLLVGDRPLHQRTSTSSGKTLASADGREDQVDCAARSRSHSSRSRNDMWQPEQPPSQTVASRSSAAAPWRRVRSADPLLLLRGRA